MASDDPDRLRLRSAMQIPTREERYDIKEVDMPAPSPQRHSFLQMFDFSSLIKQHPHKYDTIMKEDVAEETAREDAIDSKAKLERKLAERSKSHDLDTEGASKKLSQQRIKSAEKQGTRITGERPVTKRSSSYANIHDMKKTIPDDQEVQHSYFQSLNKELAMGLDDYVYNHGLTDSEDDAEPVSFSATGKSASGSLLRRHSVTPRASFDEEPEMKTIALPDGSEVKLPDVDAISPSSSADVSPAGTPKSSPRLRPRHELTSEDASCVPIELHPDKKKLLGIGPMYQPPSEHVCVHRDDAKQLNLLQRVVKEGFSATTRTPFHQREDMDFFPPDQPQTQASVDSAKDMKKKFMTRAEINFLSPSSM
ncbi:uncharacterized protein [Ptychodera flava]|uniref:uncharacterized protein n=1 Tax=Ptychodera flava TaxID=63121 RepID=UPI003969BD6F